MPSLIEGLGPFKGPSRMRANSRLSAQYLQAVTLGPWQETGGTTSPVAGEYLLGLMTVRQGLSDLTTLSMRVSTGATTGTAFYVFYNVDDDGMPGTLAHKTAAFALTGGAGTKAVAAGSIATDLAFGEYYCGTYTPSNVTGTPAIVGCRPAKQYVSDIINQARAALQYIEAVPGTAPAASLSAVAFDGVNEFNFLAEHVPTLFGA